MPELTQTASALWLVKPLFFTSNAETSGTNAFQKDEDAIAEVVNTKAQMEFGEMCRNLEEAGVNFIVAESVDRYAPDSVFPNNWVSFHHDGTMVLYPMMAVSRRRERDLNLISSIRAKYDIKRVLDFSDSENKNLFLEGTGSIVYDHRNRIAFAALSPRTDETVLSKVCNELGYEPRIFHSYDRNSIAVYHTNVLLHIGETYAIVCSESITDSREREQILSLLKKGNKEIIEITLDQMQCFAGNMLQVKNEDSQPVTIISASAFDALSDQQFSILLEHSKLLRIPVSQIEKSGGGSVRCMLAEIFLPQKNKMF